MTDTSYTTQNSLDDLTKGQKHLERRHSSETRFKWTGRIAIFFSLAFLALMVGSIFLDGKGAISATKVAIKVNLGSDFVDPFDIADASFGKIVKDGMKDMFPDVKKRKERKALYGLLSSDAQYQVENAVRKDPSLLGGLATIWVSASDDVDLLMKGIINRELPENERRMSDQQIAWVDSFIREGKLDRVFNTAFFTNGASQEPELAGILSALMGSIFSLVICFVLSFPIGIMAAIYLEEFAPKNKFSDFIEININNLAAVPSIVFGLLGLSIFLNTFGLPRSAPLVGGMVLSLMTLPTIIIASRASLRAVPPSIREAALGMGASSVQSTFHHVAPLALPGMFTGAIVGMARALGDTAPLLMIGMVAFVVDVPKGFLDTATALPVQIFLWADSPERAFLEKTSAAIIVLLIFLIIMNIAAIILRKKFELRF
ncbi:MAG TPA: phosphate ABC transporter permease PtsA [Rhodobacteraceae bacterium]|nr:phosphate ABC transporter permease PtsA [Paracoccaceae bacterium]